MPLGTTAQSVRNMPPTAYVVNDAEWNSTAKKNVKQILSTAYSDTNAVQLQLPQSGLAAELLIKFDGTLVIATEDSGDAKSRWPYGLLGALSLSVNGQQDLFGVLGEDLRVREDIAFPAFTEQVDAFPGDLGGGDVIDTGTYPVHLSWRVPIATELVTLTGALYAQSPSTQIQVTISPAGVANLVPAGDGGTSVLTGTWTVTETFFVPAYDSQGRIIVPSGIAYLHAMQAVDLPLTGTGDNRLLLVRGSGNMQRLFMAFTDSDGNRMSTAPGTSTAELIDNLVLTYGATQFPYNWTPASDLLHQNNLDYGFTPPYDYVILDTLKQNPSRDAIVYAGLTELAVIATVDAGVSNLPGNAHLVQENLF
jgi:hypothetical protein